MSNLARHTLTKRFILMEKMGGSKYRIECWMDVSKRLKMRGSELNDG